MTPEQHAEKAIAEHEATVPRYECPHCGRLFGPDGVTNPSRCITLTKCCGYVARNIVTPPGVPCIVMGQSGKSSENRRT